MKKNIFIFTFTLSSIFINAQMGLSVSFEEFRKNFNYAPKPFLLYISTDWCSVCKIQQKEIKTLSSIVNPDFYFLTLDAEGHKKKIIFLEREYFYSSNGNSGLHELAYELTQGENTYPVWIFFDKNGRIIAKNNGLLKSNELENLIQRLF